MIDADVAKVDTNTKSDASGTSKIEFPKINVKIGIGKRCAILIELS